MQVILLADVPKIGKKYEVKSVADGYVRNHLAPRNLVTLATKKNIKHYEKKREEEKEKGKMRDELLAKSMESLVGSMITKEVKGNEDGHLFSGISKEDICALLTSQLHMTFSPEHIGIERPIKEFGEFKIPIVVGDKKGEITLVVKKEEKV